MPKGSYWRCLAQALLPPSHKLAISDLVEKIIQLRHRAQASLATFSPAFPISPEEKCSTHGQWRWWGRREALLLARISPLMLARIYQICSYALLRDKFRSH